MAWTFYYLAGTERVAMRVAGRVGSLVASRVGSLLIPPFDLPAFYGPPFMPLRRTPIRSPRPARGGLLPGSERVAMRVVDGGSNQLYYLFTDHLGSTSEVRRADGSLHSAQGYTAFGSVWYRMGSLPTDHTYTGQTEIEFGLVHYGARIYDPALGRFVQAGTLIP